MPNNYNSSFTGQHNDEYDARITALENFRQTFLNTVYPVGSIYISMNETDPGTLFGGTWERISGRFLLGCGGTGPGQNNSNSFGLLATDQETWFSDLSPGSMSGEYYHTLSVAEMPEHTHGTYGQLARINDDSISGTTYGHSNTSSWWFKGVAESVRPAGSTYPHNNIPPYLTVAMWKRVA